jgi:hypothetical protein
VGDVRRLGRYAFHRTDAGHLLEYDRGCYWRTRLIDGERARQPLEPEERIPFGPWYHHRLCDCEKCIGD